MKVLVGTLTSCPVTDVMYKPALKNATDGQLKEAIEFMKNREGNKGRIIACEKELRRREKNESYQNNN